MNNDCIVVYESIYNRNTEKLACIMARTLGCEFIRAQEALKTDLSQYKAVGFGSGIYFGSHHPAIFEVVKNLDKTEQHIFIFSSRGAPVLGNYHDPIKKLLLEKGKKIAGEFSVRGYDETGPWVIIGGGNVGKPDEKDIKKAAKFLRNCLPQYCMPDFYEQIKTKNKVKDGFVNTYSLSINETQVILKGDIVTINQSVCKGCGKCVNICPLSVIESVKNKAVPFKELDCTLCRLCEINCRERAINLHYNWLDAIKVAVRHGKRKSL
ncbi:MAG: 4Fe-4S binding protein [Bacteroidales bacterium]|jgi:flavodoxin/NAD-dependent dihydropyrimidine dehydrogenase PreA subunit|nr:4Fe-4S binding protein [Bacteroidales bacterium]